MCAASLQKAATKYIGKTGRNPKTSIGKHLSYQQNCLCSTQEHNLASCGPGRGWLCQLKRAQEQRGFQFSSVSSLVSYSQIGSNLRLTLLYQHSQEAENCNRPTSPSTLECTGHFTFTWPTYLLYHMRMSLIFFIHSRKLTTSERSIVYFYN